MPRKEMNAICDETGANSYNSICLLLNTMAGTAKELLGA